jgi:signal transduction histidine kinase
MEDLSLHILDVVENSIKAKATRIEIRLRDDAARDRITLEIVDDGVGLDAETVQKALDPFFSTKETRSIGLGLPLLAAAARAANGDHIDQAHYSLDTKEIKTHLNGVSIASPEIIRFIRDHIKEGLNNLRRPI